MIKWRWNFVQKLLILTVSILITFQFLLVYKSFHGAKCILSKSSYIRNHLSGYRQIFEYLKSINISLIVLNENLLTLDRTFAVDFVTFGLHENDGKFFKNSILSNIPNFLADGTWRFREHLQLDYRLFGLLKIPVNVSAHFSFSSNLHILHLAVLFERSNSYLWISEFTNHEFSNFSIPLPMAIENFQCRFDDADYFFCYPPDIEFYLWQLKYAKFSECPYEDVVWKFEEEFQLAKIDTANYALVYKEMMRIAKKFRKPVLLAFGSLLGWYRQCDFIVHSKDIDMQMFLQDFDYEFFNELFRSEIIRLHNRMGNVRDGFSLRTYLRIDTEIWMDLFAMHPHETGYYLYVWHKGLLKLHRYQYPPMGKICSAELLGVLIYVPCSPLTYIEAEYGTNGWYDPKLYTYVNLKTVKRFSTLENMTTYIHVYAKRDCENPSIITGCDNETDGDLIY